MGLHGVLSAGQVVVSGSTCVRHFGKLPPMFHASCRWESLLIVKEMLMAHGLYKSFF